MMLQYYGVHLIIIGNAPSALFIQQDKNDLYLSANGRLCDVCKMAHLVSRELAEQFRDAYLPRLKKRYGSDIVVRICDSKSRDTPSGTMAKRIAVDSELAKRRIETGILAANIIP